MFKGKLVRNAAVGLALLGMVSLDGCFTPGGGSTTFDMCGTVNAVQIQQGTIEVAAATLVSLYHTGVVSNDVYNKAGAAYNTWAMSQATVVTALEAINDTGGNPSAISVQQYENIAAQVIIDAASFMAIYANLAAVKASDMPTPAPTASPVPTCTMTDAQIASTLTVQPWSSFAGVK